MFEMVPKEHIYKMQFCKSHTLSLQIIALLTKHGFDGTQYIIETYITISSVLPPDLTELGLHGHHPLLGLGCIDGT